MSILGKHLALDIQLREVVSAIGVLALAKGKAEAAERCLRFASQFGDDARFTANLKVDALLCWLIDHMRNAGRLDLAAEVEVIIQACKDGEHRTIIGTTNFDVQTLGELDGQLEQMRKVGELILPR